MKWNNINVIIIMSMKKIMKRRKWKCENENDNQKKEERNDNRKKWKK